MVTNVQLVEEYAETIEDVMSYIRRHIQEPLNREVLAEVAGFSVPHFHRVFTEQVGESAVSYVRRLRMERAARKLRMGAVDITEVARAAGYESHAAFSKAFKQQFGFSPSEFRQLGCTAATQILREGDIK
ncbi:MAG TPA: AraC family transcriptional regulator [Anaerolineales bacterium]|jgi:AraC family transcriptional regulator|nr:AraC family transcriptional regulator [Anaerolineales bacterium]